jgi:hypothetical protein
MLFKRLDSYVVYLLYIADARDKSVNLVERDSSLVIIVLNDRYKGVTMCKV